MLGFVLWWLYEFSVDSCGLTHWPLGDVAVILEVQFLTRYTE